MCMEKQQIDLMAHLMLNAKSLISTSSHLYTSICMTPLQGSLFNFISFNDTDLVI